MSEIRYIDGKSDGVLPVIVLLVLLVILLLITRN